MKIETQILEDHQARLTVEVENDLLVGAKRRAARKIANRVKIPGFRPGKAPYQVIVRQVGDAAILEEALEFLVDDIYPKVLEEAKIDPYGPGKLDKVNSMEPPVLEFLVPLKAEINLGEYHSLTKPYELPQVKEEQVDAVLNNLRERQAVVEPVERPAQEGDLVTVKINAERTQINEGQEEATLIRERSAPVVIRPEAEAESETQPDATPEWPFPGFSRQLVGLSPKDEKTIPYTYPTDSVYQALSGVGAVFHLVVENVKSRTLPELNDEFAPTVGEYTDLETLRKEIRSSLEEQAIQEYNQNYDEEILEEAVKGATFKYPPQMVEREVDEVIDNLNERLKQQNQEMDLYLKTREIDMPALRKEALPVAESRLKKSLFLLELVNAEHIEVKPDELQTETMNTMKMLTSNLPEKEARKLANENTFRSLVSNVMTDMLIQRSRERLRDISSGKMPEQNLVEQGVEETVPAESAAVEEQADVDSKEHRQLTEAEATPAVDTASEEASTYNKEHRDSTES